MTTITESDQSILAHITAGKTDSDIIALLTMTDVYKSKADARKYLEALKSKHGVTTTKTSTKSGQLKAWFLSQDNPAQVTGQQIKDECIKLEMKGGSVTYYVNAYKLAIELAAELAKK